MSTIISGTIRDETILPDTPLVFPEGTAVRVAVSPLPETMRQIRNGFGSLADLPQEDWDDLDSIIASRKESSFRDVEG